MRSTYYITLQIVNNIGQKINIDEMNTKLFRDFIGSRVILIKDIGYI